MTGADIGTETTRTDTKIENQLSWVTKKVYVCPRGIYLHRGNPSACGKMCKKVQGDGDDEFEEEQFLKILVTRKRVVFNRDICREDSNVCPLDISSSF